MNPLRYEFTVRWRDTDMAGIVFNANFYVWMEDASNHFFAALGFPMSRSITENKIGLPAVESSCQFKKPLIFEDEAVIHTEVLHLGDKSIQFGHEFRRGDELIAIGKQTRVFADISGERLKAVSIPAEIREAILALGVKQES